MALIENNLRPFALYHPLLPIHCKGNIIFIALQTETPLIYGGGVQGLSWCHHLCGATAASGRGKTNQKPQISGDINVETPIMKTMRGLITQRLSWCFVTSRRHHGAAAIWTQGYIGGHKLWLLHEFHIDTKSVSRPNIPAFQSLNIFM